MLLKMGNATFEIVIFYAHEGFMIGKGMKELWITVGTYQAMDMKKRKKWENLKKVNFKKNPENYPNKVASLWFYYIWDPYFDCWNHIADHTSYSQNRNLKYNRITNYQ